MNISRPIGSELRDRRPHHARPISPQDHDRTDVEKYGVDDHGFWIMCAFGNNGHEGIPACSSLQKLSHDRDSMQTAHQTLRQNHIDGPKPTSTNRLVAAVQLPNCELTLPQQTLGRCTGLALQGSYQNAAIVLPPPRDRRSNHGRARNIYLPCES